MMKNSMLTQRVIRQEVGGKMEHQARGNPEVLRRA